MHPPPMPEASVAPSGAEPSRGIEPRAPGSGRERFQSTGANVAHGPRGSEAPSLCRRRAAADAARRGWPSTPPPSMSTPLLASLPRLAPAQDTSRAGRANLPSANATGRARSATPDPSRHRQRRRRHPRRLRRRGPRRGMARRARCPSALPGRGCRAGAGRGAAGGGVEGERVEGRGAAASACPRRRRCPRRPKPTPTGAAVGRRGPARRRWTAAVRRGTATPRPLGGRCHAGATAREASSALPCARRRPR